jgi:type VI secretion system protein ImpH
MHEFLQRLAENPHGFDFYRVMRELEALYPHAPGFGRSKRPADDPVRLAQEPSVEFAPAMLAGWESGEAGRPGRLSVFFFGLFGPDGPLPLHLTEYARDRKRNERDATLSRFADLFHHRALSLLYRAWANVRPTISFDRPRADRFATYVGALAGLGMPSLRHRDAMPDATKLHFAGLLANQTRHAEGLGAILSAFYTLPVRVQSFVGAWLTLPDADRSCLGASRDTGTLGAGALLGRRIWSRQHKFRLVFGPLTLAAYRRLLPGGSSFAKLIPIVSNYAGDVLTWDMQLVLRCDEVPPTCLGRAGQLGWTTWLMPRRSLTDAADLHLDASADSMARRARQPHAEMCETKT